MVSLAFAGGLARGFGQAIRNNQQFSLQRERIQNERNQLAEALKSRELSLKQAEERNATAQDALNFQRAQAGLKMFNEGSDGLEDQALINRAANGEQAAQAKVQRLMAMRAIGQGLMARGRGAAPQFTQGAPSQGAQTQGQPQQSQQQVEQEVDPVALQADAELFSTPRASNADLVLSNLGPGAEVRGEGASTYYVVPGGPAQRDVASKNINNRLGIPVSVLSTQELLENERQSTAMIQAILSGDEAARAALTTAAPWLVGSEEGVLRERLEDWDFDISNAGVITDVPSDTEDLFKGLSSLAMTVDKNSTHPGSKEGASILMRRVITKWENDADEDERDEVFFKRQNGDRMINPFGPAGREVADLVNGILRHNPLTPQEGGARYVAPNHEDMILMAEKSAANLRERRGAIQELQAIGKVVSGIAPIDGMVKARQLWDNRGQIRPNASFFTVPGVINFLEDPVGASNIDVFKRVHEQMDERNMSFQEYLQEDLIPSLRHNLTPDEVESFERSIRMFAHPGQDDSIQALEEKSIEMLHKHSAAGPGPDLGDEEIAQVIARQLQGGAREIVPLSDFSISPEEFGVIGPAPEPEDLDRSGPLQGPEQNVIGPEPEPEDIDRSIGPAPEPEDLDLAGPLQGPAQAPAQQARPSSGPDFFERLASERRESRSGLEEGLQANDQEATRRAQALVASLRNADSDEAAEVMIQRAFAEGMSLDLSRAQEEKRLESTSPTRTESERSFSDSFLESRREPPRSDSQAALRNARLKVESLEVRLTKDQSFSLDYVILRGDGLSHEEALIEAEKRQGRN